MKRAIAPDASYWKTRYWKAAILLLIRNGIRLQYFAFTTFGYSSRVTFSKLIIGKHSSTV